MDVFWHVVLCFSQLNSHWNVLNYHIFFNFFLLCRYKSPKKKCEWEKKNGNPAIDSYYEYGKAQTPCDQHLNLLRTSVQALLNEVVQYCKINKKELEQTYELCSKWEINMPACKKSLICSKFEKNNRLLQVYFF